MCELSTLYTTYLSHSNLDFNKYQLDGVEWCVNNETRSDPPCGIRGGFIADEMGLGKTITVIAVLYGNYKPKTLIVLPPALINQWYQQIYKTTGHKCIIFHGANKKKISLQQLQTSTIVLTTYSAMTLQLKKKSSKEQIALKQEKSLLHQVDWNRIVFDEAHHLRNKKTSRHRSAKLLKTNICWLVSGTPIQNKKTDFYNLCSIIGLPASFYTDQSNLVIIARSFILKRTKKQVGINIPDITINNNISKWKSQNELELSQEIHSKLKFSCIRKTISERIDNKENKYLVLLLKARQTCILPGLLNKHTNRLLDGQDANYYNEAYKQSSKIDNVIETILKKKDSGNGKLIFCHFRGEIDLIQKRLIAGGMDKVVTFDGRVTQKQRNNILSQQNNALILQIQTGCEGLNLQDNYSEIYFVSPHWNPSVEDQAIARCHRIGQTKHVTVERFEMDKFYEEEEPSPLDKSGPISIDKHVTNIQTNKRIMASQFL